MVFEDYHLHEQIRVILIRHWVDLTQVEYGVTNGVVYVTGSLRHHSLCHGNGNGNGNSRSNGQTPVSLETTLEGQFRGVHGVRDVVFRLDPLSSAHDPRRTP